MFIYSYINRKCYILQIRVIKSGPAFTFEIEFMNGKKINVDLVPVLEFSKNIPHMSNLSEFKILKVLNKFLLNN